MTDITLHQGYALSFDETSPTELHLRAPDGRACLSIVIGPNGPQVVIEAAALAVKTEGKVAFECESFDLTARGDVSIASGGAVDVAANDAVTLEGERINLETGALGPGRGLSRLPGPR